MQPCVRVHLQHTSLRTQPGAPTPADSLSGMRAAPRRLYRRKPTSQAPSRPPAVPVPAPSSSPSFRQRLPPAQRQASAERGCAKRGLCSLGKGAELLPAHVAHVDTECGAVHGPHDLRKAGVGAAQAHTACHLADRPAVAAARRAAAAKPGCRRGGAGWQRTVGPRACGRGAGPSGLLPPW